MRSTTLLRRSLIYYWRTNLAVIAGVAVAVAVLAGALIVGASVRGSLRHLVLERLGRTDRAVVASGFFRQQLAASFRDAVPLIALEGFVTDQETGRRASRVQVYGIDETFWRFHGLETVALDGDQALISEGLARELSASSGKSVVLRVEAASPIPTESLHGRKEDVGRSVRLAIRDILPRSRLGEFSLSPRQDAIRALFVPLSRLQRLLDQQGRANVILVAGGNHAAVEQLIRDGVTLDDFGLRVRVLEQPHMLALDSRSTILSDRLGAAGAIASERAGMTAVPTLTYLANTIRIAGKEIPYSVITAADLQRIRLTTSGAAPQADAIYLNDWAARDLDAHVGDRASIDYYVWEQEGRLSTRTSEFTVAGIIPVAGAAADRDLVPEYPGITNTARLADWDPPFPIDLRRVRPIDEDYWERYRTTPKAFIPIQRGQALWGSRYGRLTALRIVPPADMALADALQQFAGALRGQLDPLAHGFSVYDVRAQSLAASAGATDFGEYFTYFSTFLVAAALLLGGLFFKLGVEERLREIGLLEAVGLHQTAIRRLFVGEGLILSALGGLIGAAGAIAYAHVIMLGLRTWWVGAVGTTELHVQADAVSLLAGAAAVIAIAMIAIWWSLRALARESPRSLLMGLPTRDVRGSDPRTVRGSDPIVLATAAMAMMTAAATGAVGDVAGFFGAGAFALLAMLAAARAWLRRGKWRTLVGHGTAAVWRLGLRSAAHRPARSVLCIALIAFATFVIFALEAFRRDDPATLVDRHSGSGGYALLLESLLPIVHDLNSPAGRDAMNLPADLGAVRFDRFRVRPGDDASCLNLYQPKNPRVLGVTSTFASAGRFAFHSSLAVSAEERANPWLLLDRQFPDGAIPVIADANSMTYVLHMKLGDDLVLPGMSEQPLRLRVVAALRDSIFQSELLMAESPFLRAFPEWEGYRFFLIDIPPERAGALTALLESRMSDFGADVASPGERLAAFHRVEYTYLSTFQVLGALGLVLGTFGLGAVLLRNVLERRRELALLRALGYQPRDFVVIILSESILLLVCGLTAGVVSAAIAIAPALVDRGGRVPGAAIGLLLGGVLLAGLVGSIGATLAALRSPLLAALRTE
jgi:ABC-type lipoprotein release transport system permease subunit